MTLVPTPPSALARPVDPIDAAIVPRPPSPELTFFGINQVGHLYVYGDTPATPKRTLQYHEGIAFTGIRDCSVVHRATRDYLQLVLLAPIPNALYVLALPCGGVENRAGVLSTQWPVRSLLGGLVGCGVDLTATAGILTARRGTTANFIDLYLAPGIGEEPQQVFAPAIDGDRNALEIAVNQVRRSLTLEPQFL